jgi:hypothetical protein
MVAVLLFLILFAEKISVSSPNRFYPLPTFKFGANSSYLFIFREVVPETLRLAVFNESEYSSVRHFLDSFLGPDSGLPAITEGTCINGTINVGGVYYPYLFSSKRGIFCQAEVRFHNSPTFLDLRLVPAITVSLLAWLFWLVGTSFWLFNMFANLSRRRKMNLCLIPGAVAWLLGHLLRYIELKILESSDVSSGLDVAGGIFDVVGYICFAACVILAIWGLSIINDDVPAPTGSMSVIASTAFVLGMFNLITWGIGDAFVQVVVAAMALAFYARQIWLAAGRASELLKSQAGSGGRIAAPFHRIYYVLLGAVVYLLVCVLISVMIAFDIWVVELMRAIGQAAFGVAFASVYYMRKAREGEYSGVAGARSDDVQEILMADLSEIPPGPDEKIADQPLMEDTDLAPLKTND